MSQFRLLELTETNSWSLSKGQVAELMSVFDVLFIEALWVESFRFRIVLRIMMNGIHRDIGCSSRRYR
jgi:hypothetical protein